LDKIKDLSRDQLLTMSSTHSLVVDSALTTLVLIKHQPILSEIDSSSNGMIPMSFSQ